MLHTLTYATDLPEGTGGTAEYWFIKIAEKYRDDAGIFRHELLHTSQWWAVTIISLLAVGIAGYFFMPIWGLLILCPFLHNKVLNKMGWYTQIIEVAAYKRQLQFPPAIGNLEYYRGRYAELLSTKYGLNITVEEALRLLSTANTVEKEIGTNGKNT